MSLIESLESRRFLSASTLSADEATLHADITGLVSAGTSAEATIRSDVGTLSKSEKALGASWLKSTTAKYKTLLKADTTGTAAVNKDVAKFDAASGSKATAAGAKLTAAANKALSAIIADSNALVAANTAGLTRIGAALPSNSALQTDIGTVESTLASRVATIQADAATVFTTDVGAIVAG